MPDPYDTLGVARTASTAELKRAYTKLAKKYHPDLNGGDKAAEAKFKEVGAAWDLLGDEEKRGRFDRGEIDASGQEIHRPPPRGAGRRGAGGARGGAQHFEAEDLNDLFAQFARQQGGGFDRPMRGEDLRFSLAVSFLDAALGASRRLTLPDGSTVDVAIPAGAEEGQVLRLRGKGEKGFNNGPAGDALIELHIAAHRHFTREGDDVVLTVPLTLKEAVLGATVRVPTLTGHINMKIPPNSAPGTRLRIKGKGIRRGDQYVELKLVFPPKPDAGLAKLMEQWTPEGTADPRADLDAA